jgi:hypothetical protein
MPPHGYDHRPEPPPADEEIEVRVVDSGTKLPVERVRVVSNDSLGGIIAGGETGSDGRAMLAYEVGGTVSIFWESETSEPLPTRSTDSYLITPELKSIQHVVFGAPVEYTNPPIELVLEVEPVPGAVAYMAMIACATDPHSYGSFVAGDGADMPLPIVVPEFRGCPGKNTFSVFLAAVDIETGLVGYDMLINEPMPSSGTFSHTFSPTRTATESFTVRFDGITPGTALSGHAVRLNSAAVAMDPFYSDFELVASESSESFTASVLDVPIPLLLDIEADFPESAGKCSTARRRTAFPQAFDVAWRADRLATIELDGDTVQFGAGDPGDVGIAADTQTYPDHFRSIHYHFPWTTAEGDAEPRLVFHPDLPDDLEVRFGFAGEDMSTVTIDMHGVDGYEGAVESGMDYREGYESRALYACPP